MIYPMHKLFEKEGFTMAQEFLFKNVEITSDEIEICKIGVKDLWQALKNGIDDFNAKPTVIVFLFVFYPLFALLITLFMIGQNMLYIAFPLVTGFTFLGPIVLVSLYEMSRYRELGQDVSWRTSFDFIHSSSFAPILALSLMMMLLYVAWLYMAQFLYFGSFGAAPANSISEFLTQIFTTRQGAGLIVYGTALGLMFAVVALAISVVSFPLALDKPVSSITAVKTSVKAVFSNPLIMTLWGLIVSALLAIGTIVFLLGLIVVVPILGHATWHLYRRLVKQ